MKGGDGQQKGSQQPAPMPRQPPSRGVEQGDGGGADQHRKEPHRDDARAKQPDPEVQQQVIEGRVDVHGRQFEHVADAGRGKIEAPAFIPPQRLIREADQAQAKCQQGQQREHKAAVPSHPDRTGYALSATTLERAWRKYTTPPAD